VVPNAAHQVGARAMSERYTYPAPVFKSRVLRARMLIELSGKRFVWYEAQQKFVLTKNKQGEVKKLWCF
jgi:hypothetical protein